MGFYDAEWLLDLAFLTDVTEKNNHLNLLLHAKYINILDMISAVKAFSDKQSLYIQQMKIKGFSTFLHLKDVGKSRRSSWDFKRFQVLQPLVKTWTGVCRHIH